MSYNKQHFLSDWEKALKKLQCRILKTFWKISGNSLPKSAKSQWDMWVWQPLLAITALLTLHCSCTNIMEERTREMVHNGNGIFIIIREVVLIKKVLWRLGLEPVRFATTLARSKHSNKLSQKKGIGALRTRIKWLFNSSKTLFIYFF